MNFNEFFAYIIGQFTLIGQSLVVIVKIMIEVAVVAFEFIAKLLKLISNQ